MSVSSVQSSTVALLLWQGFHHRWGYNHRVNRLGSWVRAALGPAGCEGKVAHAAASGTGPDTASFTDHYARVVAGGVHAAMGSTTLQLSGREGAPVHQRQRVAVRGLIDGARRVAFCNGFDLLSKDKADKLVKLHIRLGEPVREADGFSFDVDVSYLADCTSPECPPHKQEVHYALTVFWVLVTADAAALALTPGVFGRTCTWTEQAWRSEWTPECRALLRQDRPFLPAAPGFHAETALLVFQEIEVSLGSDYHLLALDLAAHDLSWFPDQGASFDLDLRYVQWAEGMKEAGPPWSWTSVRQPGHGLVRVGLVLLQLRAGQVGFRSVDGEISWSGKGASADTPEAVSALDERVVLPAGSRVA